MLPTAFPPLISLSLSPQAGAEHPGSVSLPGWGGGRWAQADVGGGARSSGQAGTAAEGGGVKPWQRRGAARWEAA